MISPTQPLLQSLVGGPLLIGDLPEACSFPYQDLEIPAAPTPLNLQQKLGYLYEDALGILLEASPRFDLLARNLQLHSDTQTTLGELDFLLRDLDSDLLIHLELATKFYLAVETPSGLALPGPDARDNYFRKLQRLRSHQLTLAQNHRSALPESYQHHPIVAQQLIYGCLFDHIDAAELRLDLVCQMCHSCRLTHIRLNRAGLHSGRLGSFDRLRGCGCGSVVVDHHVGAGGGQRKADGAADTVCATSDQGDFSCEIHDWRASFRSGL